MSKVLNLLDSQANIQLVWRMFAFLFVILCFILAIGCSTSSEVFAEEEQSQVKAENNVEAAIRTGNFPLDLNVWFSREFNNYICRYRFRESQGGVVADYEAVNLSVAGYAKTKDGKLLELYADDEYKGGRYWHVVLAVLEDLSCTQVLNRNKIPFEQSFTGPKSFLVFVRKADVEVLYKSGEFISAIKDAKVRFSGQTIFVDWSEISSDAKDIFAFQDDPQEIQVGEGGFSFSRGSAVYSRGF